MRLRHIEIFHAIYTSGSITSAAKILNVTQPSISKVLAHAEQDLGYALFERVRGKLVPTPEAHRLFKSVSTVYDDMQQLRRVARNLRSSDEARISIAATPALGMDLLPTAIASFLQLHGQTAFEIETLHFNEIERALEDCRIDIGLAFDPPPRPGLAVEDIATAEFVVLAPPDLKISSEETVKLKDLGGFPFINLSSGGPLGLKLTEQLENSGTDLNTIVSCETYHIAKSLVAEGIGITVTDEVTAISAGRERVKLWRLEPSIDFSIAIVHVDEQPLSINAREFVEHLKQKTRAFLKQER